MTGKVTIKNVAAHAGVGIGTVSRVLNNSGPVSTETRQRVVRAAEALDYHVNELGRALQSNRSKTIGCIVPSVVNPVFADAIQAAQAVAESAGYQFLLLCSEYDPVRENAAITTLIQKNVEGLVLTVSDARSSLGLELLRARGLPHCLMFNMPVNGSPAAYVDNAAASSEVARVFRALGHRHTAFLALRFSASDRSRQRFDGFRAACGRLGLPEPRLFEIDETTPACTDGLEEILLGHPHITAIHTSNDLLALSVIKAARRLGLSIPGDLSIVGFDGIAVGELVEPALATVVTDAAAMGRIAMDRVARSLRFGEATSDEATSDEATSPQTGRLPFVFRSGGSVGPVKRDGGDAATPPPPQSHPEKTAKYNLEQQS